MDPNGFNESNESLAPWVREALRKGRLEVEAKEASRQEQEEAARAADREHMLATAKESYLRSGGTESDWPKHSEAVLEAAIRSQAAEAIAEQERRRQAIADSQYRGNF